MSLSRRDFLKYSTHSSIGAMTLIISGFAKSSFEVLIDLDVSKKHILIDLIRQNDLLHLKINLFNVEQKNEGFLNLIDASKPAYMLVKLPQQHIAEELVTQHFPELKSGTGQRKSFTSSFSILTFKIPISVFGGNNQTVKNDAFFLKWNDYELVTLKEKYISSPLPNDRSKLQIDKDLYPLTLDKLFKEFKKPITQNRLSNFSFATELQNSPILPISFFECPRKLFLAFSPLDVNNLTYKIKFSNSLNKVNKYYPKPNEVSRKALFEVWNTNIWYQYADDPNKKVKPEAKIIGFSDAFGVDTFVNSSGEINNIPLQPSPLQRKYLANLTNLDLGNDLSPRNFKYSKFNTGAFGQSSEYSYFNATPFDINDSLKRYQIVGTNHITNQGKDNLDIITTRAIVPGTGLKIYVSVVSERIHQYKTSFLQQRFFIDFVKPEIDYSIAPNYRKLPYKKVIAREKRKYFTPLALKKTDASGNTINGYAVLKESFDTKPQYPDDLLKLKYFGIDHNDKKVPFESSMMFIPESVVMITSDEPFSFDVINYKNQIETITYNKGDAVPIYHQGYLKIEGVDYEFKTNSFESGSWVKDALDVINFKKAEKINHHYIYFNEKINVAISPTNDRVHQIDDNSYLETEGIFNYSVLNNKQGSPKFSDDYPILPQLGFLNAYIPQLNGIESEAKTHKVTFASDYKNRGETIFLKTLNIEINEDLNINELKSLFENVFTTPNFNIEKGIEEAEQQIKKLSSNNLNSDSLINLDLQVDGLSYGVNALISPKAKLPDLPSFDPSKIFGKAEILGFNLSKLFETLLEENLPQTKSVLSKIEDFEEDLNILKAKFQDVLNKWNTELAQLKTELKILKEDLETQKENLRNLIELPYKNEAEKLTRLVDNEIQNFVNSYAIDYNVHKKIIDDTLKEIINISRPDNLNVFIKNSIKDIYKNNNQVKRILDAIKLKEKKSTRRLNAFQIKAAKVDFVKNIVFNLNKVLNHPLLKNNDLKSSTLLRGIFSKIIIDINRDYTLDTIIQIRDIIVEIVKDDTVLITDRNLRFYLKKRNLFLNIFSEFKNAIEDFLSNVEAHNEALFEKSRSEVIYIQNKIKTSFDPIITNQVENYIKYYRVNAFNESYQQLYTDLLNKKQKIESFLDTFNYKKNEIETVLNKVDLKTIEQNLIKQLKQNAETYLQQVNESLPSEFHTTYDQLVSTYKTAQILSNPKEFKDRLQPIIVKEFETFYDKKRRELKREIDKVAQQILNKENLIKNQLKRLNELIDEKVQDLIDHNKYDELLELKRIYKIINTARTQKVEYKFSKDNLKTIDAGVAKLITTKQSKFNIDSKVEVTFKNELPIKVEKKESFIKTELTHVGVSVMDSLLVNFKRLYYQNGSNINQDFKVEVKDIQFDGVFKFVAAFEKYLKDLGGDNVILSFNAKGADLGFKYPLGNLSFGYFNLFDLKFNIFFHLPFISGDALKIILGINNPKDRFRVYVNGFPGTGYFIVVIDPKIGITQIAFLVEFGGHIAINLGVAKGSASLKAGIYYLKKYDDVELGGYVIFAGNFRVLGLFNASLVFNLRFKIAGDNLIAKGYLKASYRFSRWFKVSAMVRMSHKTSFDHSDKDVNTEAYIGGINATQPNLESNLSKLFKPEAVSNSIEELLFKASNFNDLQTLVPGEKVFLLLELNDKNEHDFDIEMHFEGYNKYLTPETYHDNCSKKYYLKYSFELFDYGHYLLKKIKRNQPVEEKAFEFTKTEISQQDHFLKDLLNSYKM